MKSQLIEKYQILKDMKPGDVAVSKDRKKVYVCTHHYNFLKKDNERIIINMNDLYEQCSDHRIMTEPIKILRTGDKFYFEK